MKIKNLAAEISQEGDNVSICFQIPVSDFVSFVNKLKESRPVKMKVVANTDDVLKQKRQAFLELIKVYQNNNPDKYPGDLYNKFLKYWGEASKDGKKIRYDAEKFFDIGKRLSTFKSFVPADEMNKMWDAHYKKHPKPTLL